MYYCLLYRELFPSGLSVLLSSSAAVMIPTISVCCASSYVENCFLISICHLYHDFWLSRVTWKIPFSVLQLVVWHYTTRKKSSHAFSWPFFHSCWKEKPCWHYEKGWKSIEGGGAEELLKMQRMLKIAKHSKIQKTLKRHLTKPNRLRLGIKKASFIPRIQ